MKNNLHLNNSRSLEEENEILRLKLIAESGTEASVPPNTPPWIENMFLKNVLHVEKHIHDAKKYPIHEIIGCPQFAGESSLSDEQIVNVLGQLEELMLEHGIGVCFSGSYSDRLKYNFITGELMREEIAYAKIPGLTICFHYEDFHPNHSLDIETRSKKFLSAWCRKNIEEIAWELDDEIISCGSTINKADIVKQLKAFMKKIRQFKDPVFNLHDIVFEMREDTGMGYADGDIAYTAVGYDDSEVVHSGKFRIFFCMDHHWWNVYSFDMPGFDSAF